MLKIRIMILLPLFLTCNLSQKHDTSTKGNKPDNEYEHSLIPKPKNDPPPPIPLVTTQDHSFKIHEDHLNDVCLQPFHLKRICGVEICGITWMKIESKNIMDINQTPIEELKNKLKYSYAVAPIKYNGGYNANITPFILLEVVDENIEVISFKLTHYPNLELDLSKDAHLNNSSILLKPLHKKIKNSILNRAKSKIQDHGGKNVYLYGELNLPTLNKAKVTGSDELISIFANLFKNQQWKNLEAEITIQDKASNQEQTYKILLNGRLFNEFIKTVLSKHQGIKNVNPTFKVPVEDKS
ncbi:hypothetical protein bcCo53_001171 (plasmid) [Borrelia coriaceae]|uniref:p23-like cell envelope protein n=1 Tax=Borrelia coriaceae ATCC 43381 TaxID=1408429 RepID=W5SW04_9SPIR|nr:hypothetical protein [Borrelia coriaceae]AHH11120.1 P23-like cell envelope protein [Borrelia coriaceae ATCC 43381]UPA17003.1 hypothetical protein bcCo53_001171 [Borrelia coriaceae]